MSHFMLVLPRWISVKGTKPTHLEKVTTYRKILLVFLNNIFPQEKCSNKKKNSWNYSGNAVEFSPTIAAIFL